MGGVRGRFPTTARPLIWHCRTFAAAVTDTVTQVSGRYPSSCALSFSIGLKIRDWGASGFRRAQAAVWAAALYQSGLYSGIPNYFRVR